MIATILTADGWLVWFVGCALSNLQQLAHIRHIYIQIHTDIRLNNLFSIELKIFLNFLCAVLCSSCYKWGGIFGKLRGGISSGIYCSIYLNIFIETTSHWHSSKKMRKHVRLTQYMLCIE